MSNAVVISFRLLPIRYSCSSHEMGNEKKKGVHGKSQCNISMCSKMKFVALKVKQVIPLS